MIELWWIALAGGVGAGLRYGMDAAVTARLGTAHPWGTFVVNVTGSFALGLVTGWALTWGPAWTAIVGTGLLGGYTTFSTAMAESLALLHRRAWGRALLHTLGMLVACTTAALVGLMLTGGG